jgi:hypothetical protein
VKILLKWMTDNWFWEYSTVFWKINCCVFLLKNPFTLLFKGVVSRDSIFIKFRDIKAFLCALMFRFKGTVSQDFLLQVFLQESSSPKPLKIPKFVDLQNL